MKNARKTTTKEIRFDLEDLDRQHASDVMVEALARGARYAGINRVEIDVTFDGLAVIGSVQTSEFRLPKQARERMIDRALVVLPEAAAEVARRRIAKRK